MRRQRAERAAIALVMGQVQRPACGVASPKPGEAKRIAAPAWSTLKLASMKLAPTSEAEPRRDRSAPAAACQAPAGSASEEAISAGDQAVATPGVPSNLRPILRAHAETKRQSHCPGCRQWSKQESRGSAHFAIPESPNTPSALAPDSSSFVGGHLAGGPFGCSRRTPDKRPLVTRDHSFRMPQPRMRRRVVAPAWSRMIWNPPRCGVTRASHPVGADERVPGVAWLRRGGQARAQDAAAWGSSVSQSRSQVGGQTSVDRPPAAIRVRGGAPTAWLSLNCSTAVGISHSGPHNMSGTTPRATQRDGSPWPPRGAPRPRW